MPARHLALGRLAALAGLSCLAAAAWTVIPAQLGDTWVYAVDSSVFGTGTETVRITAVQPVVGSRRATMAVSLRLAGSTAPLDFTAQFTDAADGSITFASTSFMGQARVLQPQLAQPGGADPGTAAHHHDHPDRPARGPGPPST
jgi:hypothetical protein